MTAVAAQPQQQPPQYGDLVAAAAVVVGTATTAEAALLPLQALARYHKMRRAALRGALEVVLSFPPEPLSAWGPAQSKIYDMNRIRRAQFVVAAAVRLDSAMTEARSRGQSQAQALLQGIQSERRYYAQHLAAIYHRSQAAARVDSAMGLYGRLLGWYTVRDSHTTPECLAADGKNFYAEQMPLIGYPGTAHPRCRCFPGRPHPGGRMLAGVRMAA